MKDFVDGDQVVKVFYRDNAYPYSAKESVASVALALKTELRLYVKWDTYLADDCGYMSPASCLGSAVGTVHLKIDKHFVLRRLWSTGEVLERTKRTFSLMMTEAEVNKIINSGQPIKRSYWNMIYLISCGPYNPEPYAKKYELYNDLNHISKHVHFAEILIIEM